MIYIIYKCGTNCVGKYCMILKPPTVYIHNPNELKEFHPWILENRRFLSVLHPHFGGQVINGELNSWIFFVGAEKLVCKMNSGDWREKGIKCPVSIAWTIKCTENIWVIFNNNIGKIEYGEKNCESKFTSFPM